VRRVVHWQVLPGCESRRRAFGAELRAWCQAASALAMLAGGEITAQLGRTSVVLAVVAMVLGLLFVAQLQSAPPKVATTPESRREMTAKTIQRLEQEQAELKKAIGELRAQVAAQQQAAVNEKTTLADINEELERQKMLAGMVALRGRGVKIVLDDSAVNKIPANDDPSLYIVHEYQLRDVLNLLWLAGAEAVSLNGERVVATTSIYCVGSTILVNDTRLSPPYEFLAIGDPAALESTVSDSANLQTLRSRVKSYGLQFSVARSNQVQVPGYSGSLEVKYATLGGKDTPFQPSQQPGRKVGEN